MWDVGHAPKDQSNRRKYMPDYAVWEIHPVMKTNRSVISAQADFCIGIASHFPLKRIANDFGGLLPNN